MCRTAIRRRAPGSDALVRKVLGPFGETPPCRLALDGQEVGVP